MAQSYLFYSIDIVTLLIIKMKKHRQTKIEFVLGEITRILGVYVNTPVYVSKIEQTTFIKNAKKVSFFLFFQSGKKITLLLVFKLALLYG